MSLALEEVLLEYVRVAGIFFVGGVALFNFTKWGKEFAIVSLLISLILITISVVNYFIERQELIREGNPPEIIVDILAYTMVAIILFIIWVIFGVFFSEQSTLASIAKEIEREVDITNAQLIKTIYENNQELIKALTGKNSNFSKLSLPLTQKKYASSLSLSGNNNLASLSSLAVVS
tara:strand:- start:1628 stop:2158 length:531 start_codon:yes stop_codon:yes gene_type:complete